MTVLGHLEGKDKDEVIGNLTDEQKLHLFRRWFTGVSSYFSPEELVESLNHTRMSEALGLSPVGCRDLYSNEHFDCFSTGVRAHGIKTETCTCHGEVFERTISVNGSGYLHMHQYHGLRQPKAIEWLLLKRFPWLRTFRYDIYQMNWHRDHDEQFYVHAERNLYVPISSLFTKNPEPVIKASTHAAKIWPGAGIFSDEGAEKSPQAYRFLTWLKDGPPDGWEQQIVPPLPGQSLRKFYRTRVEVEILSYEKIPPELACSMDHVGHGITEGRYVVNFEHQWEHEIKPKHTAMSMQEFGANPLIWRLNKDGSDYIPEEHVLSVAQINFFTAEILNETQGGVAPATLDSACDSLKQAPEDVVIEWANDDTVRDEETVNDFTNSIERFRAQLGGETKLASMLPSEDDTNVHDLGGNVV